MTVFRRDAMTCEDVEPEAHGFGCAACAVGRFALICLGILAGSLLAAAWLLWGPTWRVASWF